MQIHKYNKRLHTITCRCDKNVQHRRFAQQQEAMLQQQAAFEEYVVILEKQVEVQYKQLIVQQVTQHQQLMQQLATKKATLRWCDIKMIVMLRKNERICLVTCIAIIDHENHSFSCSFPQSYCYLRIYLNNYRPISLTSSPQLFRGLARALSQIKIVGTSFLIIQHAPHIFYLLCMLYFSYSG